MVTGRCAAKVADHAAADEPQIASVRRLLVKVGTRVVTDPSAGLDMIFLDRLARQIARLKDRDIETIIVTSGSVHLGRQVLRHARDKETLTYRQATAAIGQPELMRNYSEALSAHGLVAAQVLLTMDDMAHRERYINIRNMLELLLRSRVVPVINENDSVSVEGVTFVENDKLAAIVATKMKVDLLVFLSDQPGLFTENPLLNPNAELIPIVHSGEPLEAEVNTTGGPESRGGMEAKLASARIAAACGIPAVMTTAREENVLLRLCEGERVGTLFLPGHHTVNGKKPWLATVRHPAGCVAVDAGACRALSQSDGASLLASGIVGATGDFRRGDLISVYSGKREIARGLTNYSSAEIRKIMGHHSKQIADLLSEPGPDEVIHRDNLVMISE